VVVGVPISTVRRMDGILAAIAATGLAIYVVTSMLSLGLSSGRTGLSAALTDRGRTVRLVVAGAVVAPLAALAVGSLVGLAAPLLVGLLLLGAAAGPPALGAFGRRIGDAYALPAGHTAVLTALGVVVTPLLLLWGVGEPGLQASDVLLPLAAGIVLPLVGGVVARNRDDQGVTRLLPSLERITLAALAVGGGVALVLALPAILRAVGTGGVLALVLFGAICLVAGVVIGGRRPGQGGALVVVTLQRNLPVAALLAITTFRSEPAVLAMVLGGVVLLRVLQVPFAGGGHAQGGHEQAPTGVAGRPTVEERERLSRSPETRRSEDALVP
jgi:predicted Na+-dependent transporter